MRIGPVSLFERGHCNGDAASHYVIAALHWRWSVTWRWAIWWWPWDRHTGGWAPIKVKRHNNGSGNVTFGLPLVGVVLFMWQENLAWRGRA